MIAYFYKKKKCLYKKKTKIFYKRTAIKVVVNKNYSCYFRLARVLEGKYLFNC